MSLNLGIGAVRTDFVLYKQLDIENGWGVFDNFTDLLTGLRNRHGEINVTIMEGLATERFRFEVWDQPFLRTNADKDIAELERRLQSWM